MRHGMPEVITGVTFKAGGIMVADVNKVKKEVKFLYDHRNPASPFIYEWDKQVESGVSPVTGWNCPPAAIPSYYGKPLKVKIKAGFAPRLRAIRTSGLKKGYVYLTSKSIPAGTEVTVLQENVTRIDWDKAKKSMTEILYNFENYWLLQNEIEYP